jgi:hypothetical protein
MDSLVASLDGGVPRVERVQGNSWHAVVTRRSDAA